MREINNVSSAAAQMVEADDTLFDYHFRNTKGKIVPAVSVAGAPIADSHCHLDMLPHPELALARARWHGIRFVVSVVDPSEDPDYTYQNLSSWQSQAAELLKVWANAEGRAGLAELAELVVPKLSESELPELAPPKLSELQSLAEMPELQAPHCRIIIGCHPHNASKYSDALEAELRSYLKDQRTAAIGEIGLDYHYDASPRETQREVFGRQLALAKEYGLPVALHLREAHADGLAILNQVGWPPAGVLLHCYTLGPRELQPFLDRGAVVAFGGTLTFKKADELRQTAAQTALEKIMTETDAPFMTPEPLRGTLCGPEHTLFTAARLAEIRSASQPEEVYQLLTEVYQNALAFFDQPRFA